MYDLSHYVFFNNILKINLHGMNRYEALIAVKDFIYDAYLLNTNYIAIIHGKGEGILRKTVWDILKKSPYVVSFQLDYYNSGATVVLLKKRLN